MKVLLVKDEHGIDIYDVSTPEKLLDVAHNLVLDRLEQGYYISILPEAPKKPFTDEEFANLPESLKKTAQKQLDEYKQSMRHHSNECYEYELVQKVRLGYKKAAWQLLLSHTDYEGESVELKDVQ